MLCFLLVSYVYLYGCNYFFNKLCIFFRNPSIPLKNSVIKGYHLYEIRPPLNLTDSLNKITCRSRVYKFNWPTCISAWFGFQSFPTDLHNVITDVERNLKLSDISGLPVGHVPRGLSLAFLQLIENNCQIRALTIGDVMEKGGGISYSLWLFNHMFTRHHQLCQRGNFQCNRTNAWEKFHGIGGYIKVWTTVCIVIFFF